MPVTKTPIQLEMSTIAFDTIAMLSKNFGLGEQLSYYVDRIADGNIEALVRKSKPATAAAGFEFVRVLPTRLGAEDVGHISFMVLIDTTEKADVATVYVLSVQFVCAT